MIITATKVMAIHIPYPTPAPPYTHTETCPPPPYLTLSLWWISAPLSNSTSAMERCPYTEAQIMAVLPSYTTSTDTVRFSSTSSYTHRLWPPPLHLTLFLWWISAPRSNSTSTMERCPFSEAIRRAVLPSYTT